MFLKHFLDHDPINPKGYYPYQNARRRRKIESVGALEAFFNINQNLPIC